MRTGIRSRPWAGIDIGSYSVKLVALMGPRHWVCEIPLRVPETERDTPAGREAVAKLVAECLELAGLGPRAVDGVTLGIAGPDVIIKQISLPYMDEAEVAQALRFEARKHLPFDPQAMVIDFQILGRSVTEKRMDILLAAVSQDRLDRHIAPLRLIGLDPDIVDATPLALTNALFEQVEHSAQPQLMLDIGCDSSHLVLYHRGEPYFARRIEFGGRSITEAVARGMKIPFEEAEEWKVATGRSPGSGPDWSLPEMRFIHDALRYDLAEELRRSVAFYRTMARLGDSFTLWVSGGSARLPGLAERLGELTEGSVRIFDPLGSRTADGTPNGGEARGLAPQFAQATGLALHHS